MSCDACVKFSDTFTGQTQFVLTGMVVEVCKISNKSVLRLHQRPGKFSDNFIGSVLEDIAAAGIPESCNLHDCINLTS